MPKRVGLAVVLSALVLIGYSVLMNTLYPPDRAQDPGSSPATRPVPPPVLIAEVPAPGPSGGPEERWELVGRGYRAWVSSRGAGVVRWELSDFRNLRTGEPSVLVDVRDAADGLFLLIGIDAGPGGPVTYGGALTSGELVCRATRADGIELEKRYRPGAAPYGLDVAVRIRNSGPGAVLLPSQFIVGTHAQAEHEADDRLVEAVVDSRGSGVFWGASRHYPNPLLSGLRWLVTGRGSETLEEVRYEKPISWAGVRSRHFALAAKLSQEGQAGTSRLSGGGRLAVAVVRSMELKKEEEVTDLVTVYGGPLAVRELRGVHPSFEKLASFGSLNWLSQILLLGLRGLRAVVRNWGLAIILLGIAVNLLLFPLSLKSLASMRVLQELQPKVAALREKYKDQPQRLSREMAELYKKHKANPLGGCLPMLLQLPVFFALYPVFLRAIELRGARFLWVGDLSGPDEVARLPFSVIGIQSVNVLPILMIISSVFQQRVSMKASGGGTPQQRQMMAIMPWIFGFIFYSMPSGLVLYWLVYNLVSTVLQQRATSAQIGAAA